MRKSLVCSASVLGLLFAAACGGGDGGSSAPSRSSSAPAAAPAATGPTAGTAGVHGAITFEGEAPKSKKIGMGADPVCQAAHEGPVVSDVVMVNDNGTLKGVFVYVKSGLEGKTYAVPAEEVTLDQEGCQYTPHVLGMQAKQTLKILNSDDTLHNVHALPATNDPFNIAMPKFLKKKEVTFDSPEIMIRVKCEVHPWMGAWIGVTDHPFFSVSDGTGSFSVAGLPAGDYTIEAWHEKYGQLTEQVTLADDEVKELSFGFKAN